MIHEQERIYYLVWQADHMKRINSSVTGDKWAPLDADGCSVQHASCTIG